jgi:hypothetical protein
MIDSRSAVRQYLPWMVTDGQMAAWRWVAARVGGFGEISLGLLVVVAGLMFGAGCGAPDEVVRHASPAQTTGGDTGGGGFSGTGAGGTTGSTAQPAGGLPSQGGAGDSGGAGGTGGKSRAGGTVGSGGTGATGGKVGTGGASATGGKSGTGGTSATGGKTGTGGAGSGGTGAGGTIGDGGINPFATGGSSKGGAGGGTIVSSGGTGASGGAGGTTSTSTAPPTGLQVWVVQKTTGDTGRIVLNLRIDNKTAATADMSTVTLRYWYQDEGLGTAVVLAANYVSIGYSNLGKVTSGTAAANPSPVTGADHYLELSFSGTLAAVNDTAHNDQFNIQVTLHTAGYTGAVDVTNDYSYDSGAAAVYEKKITLHDKSGGLIWGTAPGKG